METQTEQKNINNNKNIVNNNRNLAMSDIHDSAADKNDENWRSKYGFVCSKCETTYSERDRYLQHLKEKHPDQEIIYTCALCYLEIQNYNRFRNHCYRHFIIGRYKCSICSKSFSQQSRLKCHMEGFHDSSFSCDKCKKSFLTYIGLKIHTQQYHSDTVIEYKCNECNKTLQSQNGFTQHMAMHKTNKYFLCDLCGSRFTQKTNLIIHMRCHNNDKKFACELCPMSFCNLSKLLEHNLLHSNNRQYRCKICNKSYKTKRYMQYHFSQHNAKNTFVCNVCGKGFLSAHKLKKHKNIHFEEKPYKCQYCVKGFTNFGNRLKHTKKMHKIDQVTGMPMNVSKNDTTYNHNSGNDNKKLTDVSVASHYTCDENDNDKMQSNQHNVVDITNTQAYIWFDKLSDGNIKVEDSITIVDLKNIDVNNQLTILKDEMFSPNRLCNGTQINDIAKDASIDIGMSETHREQELELSDGYIREQMKGCASYNFPEVPDFNMSPTPTVYDTYPPNISDIFGLTIDPNTQAEGKTTSTVIHSQNSNKLAPFVLSDAYHARNSVDESSSLIHQNISQDHETWTENAIAFLHNDSATAENGDNILIDDKLYTSYSSTSFIFSNDDNNENATSDAQYNAWNISHDSFYVAEQSKCNFDDLINNLRTQDLLPGRN